MKKSFNFWPYGIGLAFFLFFCYIALNITIALTHGETLVSDSYYEQEIDFQKQIEASARAHQAGASMVCDTANRKLVIAIPQAQSGHLSGSVELYRPSDPSLDQKLDLSPAANGSQIVDLSRLTEGLWLVRTRWTAEGQSYFLQERIVLAGQ
jgi:hypothetical protein